MNKVRSGERGFTLLEIIVVLAVLGALASMLAPVVFRYIDDASQARAQADTRTIAASIAQMYKDTGRWPFYAATTGQGPLPFAAGDAVILTSNAACDTGDADLATCDDAEPEVGSATGWTVAGKADAIANQLITNAPTYATTGPRRWRGPYLDAIPSVDPWGRSYLVNVSKTDPADTTPEAVFVLSAGPNGTIETNGDTLVTANPSAGGDDVVARVK